MPKKFLFTFVIFICAINIAYANDDAIFVTERNAVNYYVLGDVIHKSPVKPDDLFQLDIGEEDASNYNRTMYSYTVRLKRNADGNRYVIFKHYGGSGRAIYGTVYEDILNF